MAVLIMPWRKTKLARADPSEVNRLIGYAIALLFFLAATWMRNGVLMCGSYGMIALTLAMPIGKEASP